MRERWWCAQDGAAGCGFERAVPPSVPPRCLCGKEAAWEARARGFFCEQSRCASDCFGLLRMVSDGFGWLRMAFPPDSLPPDSFPPDSPRFVPDSLFPDRRCPFERRRGSVPRPPPTSIDDAALALATADATAAMLTAAAFGPLSPFAFVSPTAGAAAHHGVAHHGADALGVFARVALRPGQVPLIAAECHRVPLSAH